ncbi:MAG: VWA domain-containing protein [Clostridia bacterium]|nr:VWA domain-containing protein [Clostridia bacterium]
MNSIELSFERPWLLLLLLPAAAIILFPFLRLPRKRRKSIKKIVPMILHLIVVAMLVILLSGMTIINNNTDQAIMVLMDLSGSTASVQEEINARTDQLLGLIKNKNDVGVVAFGADQLYAVNLKTLNEDLTVTPINSNATNIEAALRYTASLLPDDKAGRIILMTDGKETDGDMQAAATLLTAKGIRVDAVCFNTTAPPHPEMQLNRLTVPEGAYVGDEITIAAEVQSTVAGTARLIVYCNDKMISDNTINVSVGLQTIDLVTTIESVGLHTYQVRLSSELDTLRTNNDRYACLDVAGKSSVLLITDTKTGIESLEAMLSVDSDVTVAAARYAPKTIVELCDYDEIILCNVDYKDLPEGYDALLDTYVSVYGRSLLVVGGSNTLMYGNMDGTAIETMLPVELELLDDGEGESVALMLVLDCSSSMSRNSTYLSVAKQGAIKCVEAMSGNDYVGVVSFNSIAYLDSPLIKATDTNKDTLIRTISGLATGSGTYYTEALRTARRELLKSDADIKHIIFLSDGQPVDNGYMEATTEAAEDGITLSTIGLGYTSETLESMATIGSGRYYYVTSATDLPDIMLSETSQVTINSFIEGEFVADIKQNSALTADIESETLPMLYGYLGTTAKEDASVYLTIGENHPLFATRSHGFGTVACFTSDLKGDWSSAWLANSVGKTITQNMVSTTIASIHRNSSLFVEATPRGNTVDIVVTTVDTSSTHDVRVTVSSKHGSNTYAAAPSSPGVYKLSVPTEHVGAYRVVVTESDAAGNLIDASDTTVAASYSGEYNVFAADGRPLLTAVCEKTGGAVFDDLKPLADVDMSTIVSTFDPLVLFAVLSTLLMIADIAIRKLRWKDIKRYFKR